MPTQRPLRYHNLHAGGPVIDQDENLYQMTSKGLFALNSSGRLDSLGPPFGYRLAVGRWLPWFTGSGEIGEIRGHVLWHYETPGRSNNEVTLAGDYLLGSSKA
jgi:hypothetical protein